MASPPTPPPTAADLQANPETAPAPTNTPPGPPPQPDPATLAQSNAPSSAPAQPPTPAQDSNHVAFNTIFQLCSVQDLSLIDYAERAEISTAAPASPSRLLITCPLVLGYLITDDLPLAHAALNRLPVALGPHPVVRALVSLVAAVHKRENLFIYARAENLLQVVSHPDFFEPRLATAVAVLKDAFVYALRKRVLELFSRAYSSIPISVAEVQLGLSSSAVLEAVSKHGWTYDSTTQILRPSKLGHQTTPASLGPSTLSSFHAVVDAVGRMES